MRASRSDGSSSRVISWASSPAGGPPCWALASHGLKTETGDVAFGEVRCTIELKVRSGGSIDVGEELEAVMTSDLEGGKLLISASIPYMLLGSEQTNLIVGSDWFLLEAQTTD